MSLAVLNRHHYRRQPLPRPAMYVGRPGPHAAAFFAEHPEALDGTALGNPYTRSRHQDRAVELYRRWLWRQINAGNRRVIEALETITADTALVCSCKRKDGTGLCHADVVAAAWSWWRGRLRGAA